MGTQNSSYRWFKHEILSVDPAGFRQHLFGYIPICLFIHHDGN